MSPILANSPNKVRKNASLGKNKYTLLKIIAPGPTSAGFFEDVLSNKDERGLGQLFMRNLNRAI